MNHHRTMVTRPSDQCIRQRSNQSTLANKPSTFTYKKCMDNCDKPEVKLTMRSVMKEIAEKLESW
jgi:hypothetical protein